MIKRPISLLLFVLLSACSIEVTAVPSNSEPIGPALPSPTALKTATSPWLGPTEPPPALTQIVEGIYRIPVTWDSLGLTGRLVFSAGTQGVDQLDLTTGDITPVFRTGNPETSWVLAAAISPDESQMVMSYAPPPRSGEIQLGYTELAIVPMDGSAPPAFLVERLDPKEDYIAPTWAPDGRYIYFVHITPPQGDSFGSDFTIMRLPYPEGEPQIVAANAIWPRSSPDGTRLTYVVYDPVDAHQSLHVANPDGSQAHQIDLPASFISIDSPMFTPDGQSIIFSGINFSVSAVPGPSWLDRLLGVQPAYANGAPADWYSIPVDGGEPKKLTTILDLGMYGTFSPDGTRFAYISYSGMFAMKTDGTMRVQLLGIENIPGAIGQATVQWLE